MVLVVRNKLRRMPQATTDQAPCFLLLPPLVAEEEAEETTTLEGLAALVAALAQSQEAWLEGLELQGKVTTAAQQLTIKAEAGAAGQALLGSQKPQVWLGVVERDCVQP